MRVSIATVTANPAIDVSASVDQVLPFHKLRCGPEARHPGGGGINIARVLHRWKSDVTAIFPAGGMTGEILKQLVDREVSGIVPSMSPAISARTSRSSKRVVAINFGLFFPERL